jgi:hypothetical protein
MILSLDFSSEISYMPEWSLVFIDIPFFQVYLYFQSQQDYYTPF